jgi:hypothetical protein
VSSSRYLDSGRNSGAQASAASRSALNHCAPGWLVHWWRRRTKNADVGPSGHIWSIGQGFGYIGRALHHVAMVADCRF